MGSRKIKSASDLCILNLDMRHLSIEIKARCSDHKKIRDFLMSHHADFKGMDHQIDTYFRVNNGRLKLREGNIENYLVFYEREDKEGPKQSKIILFASNPRSSLKEILTRTMGVLVVVDKDREIYFIENIKFHIDTVKDLGTFMEIEAIDNGIGKEKLLEQCNKYLSLFGIDESDLVPMSYSDLLLNRQN
jgi:adenylate cyclase, class 2